MREFLLIVSLVQTLRARLTLPQTEVSTGPYPFETVVPFRTQTTHI